MVPIRRNVVLEALGLINQGSASAKPRGSAPWVIDKFLRVVVMAPHFQGGINGQKLHVGPSSLGHYALSLYFYLIVVHVGKPVDH